MGGTRNEAGLHATDLRELERFRNVRQLTNHWARPAGPRSYYWFLTFENATELHSMAKQCQTAIEFPYYDLTPLPELHLTLDRIAFTDDITQEQIRSIEDAAIRACGDIPPLDATIGSLGGTPGAVGFTASPSRPIRELREALRSATLTVCPSAPVSDSEFHPHITIAYSNADGVPAAEVVGAVERLSSVNRAEVTINEVALVVLQRRQRSYAWHAVSRIPLGG